MKHVFRAAALLTLTAAVVGAQRVEGRDESSWSTRQSLASGQKLKLQSPNGAITITEGRGSDVVVRADKRAERGARMDDVGFVVRRTDEGLVICAVYEDDDSCDMDSNRSRREGRRWSGNDNRNRASAAFTVQLPAGVRVQAVTGNGAVTIDGGGNEVTVATGNGRVLVSNTSGRVKVSTGNGRITVDGARGEVDASTGNGAVVVTTARGPVNASSGNGDIEVTMDDIEQAAAMRFSTGSGDIILAVPARFGAEFNATTGSGTISSEIPIRISGRVNRWNMRGTIGDGGERLALSTGSGDITIRKVR